MHATHDRRVVVNAKGNLAWRGCLVAGKSRCRREKPPCREDKRTCLLLPEKEHPSSGCNPGHRERRRGDLFPPRSLQVAMHNICSLQAIISSSARILTRSVYRDKRGQFGHLSRVLVPLNSPMRLPSGTNTRIKSSRSCSVQGALFPAVISEREFQKRVREFLRQHPTHNASASCARISGIGSRLRLVPPILAVVSLMKG